MKINFLGHASFLVEAGEYRLLFDPFLTDNPVASKKPEQIKATHIFVTHGHDDHLGDAISIAEDNDAVIIGTVETVGLIPEGIKTDEGQIGGWIPQDFGRVKYTAAAHGSGVPGGLACGFIIEFEDQRIYHAGDTGLIMDMALLEYENIDVALLPIGDRYTMGPQDALRAVDMIKPRMIVPMHYDTWPPIEQDVESFKESVERDTGVDVKILKPGETLEI